MKLRDLEARLLRWYSETSSERDDKGMYVFRGDDGEIEMRSPYADRHMFAPVESLAEAHGIRFLCPKSYAKNGGEQGTHSVRVYFEGSPVPEHIGTNKDGQAVRWKVAGGSSLDDLTLTPSIQEQDEGSEDPCGWHGFVTNGEAA